MIYDPSQDEMFIAQKSKGAFLNNKKIEINKSKNDNCIMYEFSSKIINVKRASELLGELSKLRYVKKSFGSVGIHYCYVACGRASAAVTINKDTFPEFAGKLILEEAGGIVTDFKGREINFDTRGVVFSDGIIHKDILKIIHKTKIEVL